MAEPQKEINQLVHTLSYGDAISGEVLALHRCFKEWGWSSRVYSLNVHPKLRGTSDDYIELSALSEMPKPAGEVLLHYSLGSPLNDLYRGCDRAGRCMIYHNLTPSEWFASVNPRIKRDIEAGLRELPELCSITDLLIADSAFNADELRKFGYEAHVLNLPVNEERWNVPSNLGITQLLRSTPGVHLLHVGRLAPNKCIEDIIKIFYFLHHHVQKESHLWLVGIDIDTELYSFELKRLVYELGLEDGVTFAGCRDDGELKAFYENSSVYICMSEHEGFCLPVIEAMNFGLPVVSYDSSALADTVGRGGILLKEKRHPETAELIAHICSDTSLRSRLVRAGRERVQGLDCESFKSRVYNLFSSPLNGQKGSKPNFSPAVRSSDCKSMDGLADSGHNEEFRADTLLGRVGSPAGCRRGGKWPWTAIFRHFSRER